MHYALFLSYFYPILIQSYSYLILFISQDLPLIGIIQFQHSMTDIEQFSKVLASWKDKNANMVLNVLQRIAAIKEYTSSELEMISQAITTFHRQITKESDVSADWFESCINLKKKFKKQAEILKKNQKTAQPAMEKKSSQLIEFPPKLLQGRGTNDQQFLKSLYKNFIQNFSEASQNPKTIPFVTALLARLKYLFEDKMEPQLHKRLNSICLHLSKEGSRQAKTKMLKDELPVETVAEDSHDIYLDEQTKERIAQNQRQQIEACQTGFYDEMKKKINKDATQECRFCHQKKAYCEDMKQIRAADEPMTRFMMCNNCNKKWRD